MTWHNPLRDARKAQGKIGQFDYGDTLPTKSSGSGLTDTKTIWILLDIIVMQLAVITIFLGIIAGRMS